MVRPSTVRIVLALATAQKWPLCQLDVKNAFLHGDLQEEVLVKQTQGFHDSDKPHYVCKLVKYLYGLKQAPQAWTSKFTTYLPSLGFVVSDSDPSLFVKLQDGNVVILLLYVDEVIITGSNSILVEQVIDNLGEVFDMKDIGHLTFFLGLQVPYKDNGDLFIS